METRRTSGVQGQKPEVNGFKGPLRMQAVFQLPTLVGTLSRRRSRLARINHAGDYHALNRGEGQA